jgi:hypothetical protein
MCGDDLFVVVPVSMSDSVVSDSKYVCACSESEHAPVSERVSVSCAELCHVCACVSYEEVSCCIVLRETLFYISGSGFVSLVLCHLT